MDLGIKRKSALVAASSKGLGKAIALELAREGARIVITSRNSENLKRAEDEIRALGAEVHAIKADLTVKEDIKNLIERALEACGSIDILVTNAGGPPPGTFEDFDDEDWLRAFNLTFLSAQRLIKGVLPRMKEKRWGRIIGLTSVSVKQPLDNLILSNAIRSAVVGLFKTLSRELAPYNILVNCVAPGLTRTERMVQLARSRAAQKGLTEEEALKELAADVPLRRLAEPEELAALVVFLASERASYITGTTIQVDGGLVRSLL